MSIPEIASPIFTKGERVYDEFYVIRAESFNTLPDNLPENCRVILPVNEFVSKSESTRLLREKGHTLCVELPRLIFSRKAEENAVSLMKKAKENGATEALCSNIGHIPLIKSASLTPFGSFGLNITNPYSYGFYAKDGVENTLLSFELTLKQIGSFADSRHSLFCYGRVPVMMTRACVNLGKKGCADCKNGEALTDRLKQKFPVLCRKGYCEILNSRPLYMGDKKDDMLKAGISSFVLWFTTETKEEADDVIFSFVTSSPYPREFTRGLYYRKEK